MDEVDTVLSRMSQAGLKVRAKKCNFRMTKLECLGFIIFFKGIKPITKKVRAMLNVKPLKMVKQL